MTPCQHCGREHPPATPTCPLTGDSMQHPGLVGQRVDRYEVLRLLGSGGFGAVYRARHVHTGADVALKLLKKCLGADQGMLERFLREARAAASVGNEHIVRVMDAGIAESQAFLALELLEGMDLKELAQREGPLPHVRLVLLVLQVLDGLAAAHARGIVHRDMKPANVFVTRRVDPAGVERDFVKLLDFGISKMHGDAAGSGLTMTGVAMGTPSYMAPEQFFDARSVDQRADLYSVAAMLYELLSGRLPFDAESYAHLIVKVRTEQAPLLHQIAPAVPLPLAQVVTVGLAKEPQQRWQTAQELGQALRSALNLPAAGNTPIPPSRPQATPSSLPPAPIPAGALDRTHTPTAAAPPPTQPPLAPSPAVTPTGQAGWVAPTTGGANPGAPRSAAPVAMATQPPPLPTQPPPRTGGGALKWVVIVGGFLALGAGCCTCAAILGSASSAAGEPAQVRVKAVADAPEPAPAVKGPPRPPERPTPPHRPGRDEEPGPAEAAGDELVPTADELVDEAAAEAEEPAP